MFSFLLSTVLPSQSNFSPDIKSKLEKMELDFYEPIEQKFKTRKSGKNRFFKFDLHLIDKKSEQEIYVILRDENGEDDIVQFPHIEFTRLLANLATNDQEEDIMVVTYDTKKLLARNSDWGSEAYFKTRKEISDYPYAKLVSFYKEGYGLVSIMYCFDDPDLLPFLLAFKTPKGL
jgi:hypothetical protein